MVLVLRIGHRKERDKRITTHIALVARAFGAEKLIISGDRDEHLITSVNKVVAEWGGEFTLEIYPREKWKEIVLEWKQENKKIVHLTMYGQNIIDFKKTKEFQLLRSTPLALLNLMIIVGGEKVPGSVFQYADWNIAITNQPHSEVSSLAIFLEHLIPDSLKIDFPNAKRKIIPSLEGKKGYENGH
ncbi:MAG: tRNA (cytidine(56)-2'-O)-methyltransferase [Candidatus Hodarchaeales archaeon]